MIYIIIITISCSIKKRLSITGSSIFADTTDKKLAKYCVIQNRDNPTDEHLLYKFNILVKINILSLLIVSIFINIIIELEASSTHSYTYKIS